MEVSDITAKPVELGAELRLRVSPAGVLARGTIERTTREGLTATATVRRDRRTVYKEIGRSAVCQHSDSRGGCPRCSA